MTFFIANPAAHNAGYMVNDNRASGGRREEADIKQCPHCEAVILLKKAEDWCPKCNGPICPGCAVKMATEGCIPFKLQIERGMEEAVRRKQLKKACGIE